MKYQLRASVVAAIALFVVSYSSPAQTPQRVPRLTDERMSHQWYVEQSRLWQLQTERVPTDAGAWFNYYRAVRYSALNDTNVRWDDHHERVELIADAMERVVPNSYEYHFVRWSIGGNDRSLHHHLERALELNPDFAELAPALISYYEIGGDREKVKLYARRWYETRALSPSLFEYTKNVLASLEPNAILFTAGDLDTYPIWILQYVHGIRADVTVVNTSLILVPEYCEWLMKEFSIKGDRELLAPERVATSSASAQQASFIRSVAVSTTGRPVYTALTVPTEQVKLVEDDLYIVGLANRYSATRIDNVALLKRSWDRFRLDYLDGLSYTEDYGFNRTWLSMMNLNYVTPALLLFQHCSTSGRSAEGQVYRDLLVRLGREAGREQEVEAHLRSIESTSDTLSVRTMPSQLVDTSSALDNELARSITLFPNPAVRQLNVSLPSPTTADLRIITLGGKLVRELKMNDQTFTIDVSAIPAGSYFLKITTPAGAAIKRFEIKH